MTDLTEARGRLGKRQGEVLTLLLAGEVPPGFDEVTTRSAADQLVDKRRLEALSACPELADLGGFTATFSDWARSAPRAGCAHDDVSAFLTATGHRREVRWWRAEHEVLAGSRSIAWIRRRGRRELLIGFGATVWRLAWQPERSARASDDLSEHTKEGEQ